MNESLRGFARRIAASLGLPHGLGESIMEREGGFLVETFDPGSPKCRACMAKNDGECPLEEIADLLPGGIPLPFGPPMMGVNAITSKTSVNIGMDEDGRLRVTGRKTGSISVKIPVDEFPDKDAAEAMLEVFLAIKAIEEANERLRELREETDEFRKFASFEPGRLQNYLWDKFPAFMNKDDIKIAESDSAFLLVVENEEKDDVAVDPVFGRKILDRQRKLEEARETIAANEELINELTTLVEAKERIVPQLKNGARILVRKSLPQGERFVDLAETEDGKPKAYPILWTVYWHLIVINFGL
ncbi:MAG: hypothetical protein PHQ42_03945 [Patescibacteria group bacterium]|nr:hypothetical protein [Patescibacteria group bacterium]